MSSKTFFSHSVSCVSFALGHCFYFCFGVGIILVLTCFFFYFGGGEAGRRTNTSKTIFLLVIWFIKTRGIQLLMLRVTLSLDRCEALDWRKIAPGPWVQLPGEGPTWTIPYCSWTPKPVAVTDNFFFLHWFVGLQSKPRDPQPIVIFISSQPPLKLRAQ